VGGSGSKDGVRALISRLDEAVDLGDAGGVTARIKTDLGEAVQAGKLTFEERWRRPLPDRYARRLLHRDAALRYTVVVMTWGPGQRTPLHDHAGIWCVEAVVQGEMEIAQYDLLEDDGQRCRFRQRSRVLAGVGSSGCLIPPFEYHVLANALQDRPSVTIHVYGGEMNRCSVFEPRADGWYGRREKQLGYHD
jgi:predicted metal-dependent enzyme (double-stranded beta helix superfamily)